LFLTFQNTRNTKVKIIPDNFETCNITKINPNNFYVFIYYDESLEVQLCGTGVEAGSKSTGSRISLLKSDAA
jgi:hypothetical protein